MPVRAHEGKLSLERKDDRIVGLLRDFKSFVAGVKGFRTSERHHKRTGRYRPMPLKKSGLK
jgi:hypothetical protein